MADSTAASGEVVEVARPGRSPKLIKGIAAKIILYYADLAEFINDPRNAGMIQHNFNGQRQEAHTKVEFIPSV